MYLAIISSSDHEDCVQKLLSHELSLTEVNSVAEILLDCGTMERDHENFFAIQAELLCIRRPELYSVAFVNAIHSVYNVIESLPQLTVKLTARFFAYLLAKAAIPFTALECFVMTEEKLMSNAMLMVKETFHELRDLIGEDMLKAKLAEVEVAQKLKHLFPHNTGDIHSNKCKTCAKFFTSIGMPFLVDNIPLAPPSPPLQCHSPYRSLEPPTLPLSQPPEPPLCPPPVQTPPSPSRTFTPVSQIAPPAAYTPPPLHTIPQRTSASCALPTHIDSPPPTACSVPAPPRTGSSPPHNPSPTSSCAVPAHISTPPLMTQTPSIMQTPPILTPPPLHQTPVPRTCPPLPPPARTPSPVRRRTCAAPAVPKPSIRERPAVAQCPKPISKPACNGGCPQICRVVCRPLPCPEDESEESSESEVESESIVIESSEDESVTFSISEASYSESSASDSEIECPREKICRVVCRPVG